MPTTRRQTRAKTSTEASPTRTKGGRKKEGKQGVEQKHEVKQETQKVASKAPEEEDKQKVDAGEKRDAEEAKEDFNEKKDEPPVKRQKLGEEKPRVGPVYKPGRSYSQPFSGFGSLINSGTQALLSAAISISSTDLASSSKRRIPSTKSGISTCS